MSGSLIGLAESATPRRRLHRRVARNPQEGCGLMTAENGFAAIPLQHAIDRLDRMRLSEHSMESALQQVATLAKQAIPGASEVSVSLLTKDRADTVVSTGQLATDVDESQYERGYGPCLDAARSGEMQIIEDAASETRWGDYTKAAVK